jgi:hypothetical protein
MGGIALDTSLPNLRRQLAALIRGDMALDQFQAWYWANFNAIEEYGSDEDVDLLNLVMNRFAEYTSGYIDTSELLDALRTDPLVQHELHPRRTAVA